MNETNRKLIITDMELEHQMGTARVCALFEQGHLNDIQCERTDQAEKIGAVYIGRVKKAVPSLDAVFVEIAPGRECYLALKDAEDPIFAKKINSPRLVQGDELVVQIKREAIKMKPAALTTNLNFGGQYLVLTSEKHSIGVSGKIKPPKRDALKQEAEEFWTGDCGMILRTASAAATKEQLKQEYEKLYAILCDIRQKAPFRTCFSCMRQAMPEYETFLREQGKEGAIQEVITDIPEVYEHLRLPDPVDLPKYGSVRHDPKPCLGGGVIRLYRDESFSLTALYSLEKQLRSLLQEKVWMKSGGFLMIQHTEAMTVIDVNTGKSISKKHAEEQRLKINLEAAAEIARQIRLRNISGIIMVDFIDLDEADHREALLRAMKASVKDDPVQTHVVDMTRLQLMEITRKKVKKSLKEQLT